MLWADPSFVWGAEGEQLSAPKVRVMPRRPATPCSVPGCPNVAVPRYGLCAAHLAQRKREVDANRPSAAERGYDAKWRMTRARFLKEYPLCACGARATEVHHVIAKRDGGNDAWENLQAMCKRCHSRVTQFGRR